MICPLLNLEVLFEPGPDDPERASVRIRCIAAASVEPRDDRARYRIRA